MKKIYSIFCGLLLLILLTGGCISLFDRDATFSESENRELRSFPRITVSGILDGGFLTQLQEYYGDTFPGREGMVEPGGMYDIFFGFTGALEEADETE